MMTVGATGVAEMSLVFPPSRLCLPFRPPALPPITARDALSPPDGLLEGRGPAVLRGLRGGEGAYGGARPVRDEQLPGAPLAGAAGPDQCRQRGEVSEWGELL